MKNESMSTVNVTAGTSGFRLTTEKYNCIRKVILSHLSSSQKGLKFTELVARIRREVGDKKDLFPKAGSVMWYTKVVRLDLEKRGLIERVPGAIPQQLRRAK